MIQRAICMVRSLVNQRSKTSWMKQVSVVMMNSNSSFRPREENSLLQKNQARNDSWLVNKKSKFDK